MPWQLKSFLLYNSEPPIAFTYCVPPICLQISITLSCPFKLALLQTELVSIICVFISKYFVISFIALVAKKLIVTSSSINKTRSINLNVSSNCGAFL